MLKKRNLIFLFLLILGILLITGCLPNHLPTDIDRYVSKTGYNENDGSLSNPWATISHALSNTPDGGTIHVADGTYEENISFPFDKAIILKSENGASSTTIKGDDSSRVVEIVSCPDGTTLDGFTITGGNGNYGGGIYIEDSSATIQDNTISGNIANRGGGIFIGAASSPTIGGANGDDTANFNTVCGNSPNQIHPDSYPNNYIFQFCF